MLLINLLVLLVNTKIMLFQAMAAQAAAQKAALATIQQQQAAAQARNMQAAALAAQNAAKMRQRAPQLPKATLPNANNLVRNPAPVRGAIGTNASLSLPNSYQLAAGQLVQVSESVITFGRCR